VHERCPCRRLRRPFVYGITGVLRQRPRNLQHRRQRFSPDLALYTGNNLHHPAVVGSTMPIPRRWPGQSGVDFYAVAALPIASSWMASRNNGHFISLNMIPPHEWPVEGWRLFDSTLTGVDWNVTAHGFHRHAHLRLRSCHPIWVASHHYIERPRARPMAPSALFLRRFSFAIIYRSGPRASPVLARPASQRSPNLFPHSPAPNALRSEDTLGPVSRT